MKMEEEKYTYIITQFTKKDSLFLKKMIFITFLPHFHKKTRIKMVLL